MISKFKQYNGADEYRGQSTDVKPVANNGDVFHEIDTGVDEAERADDNEACYVKQVIEANELRNELYCDSNEEGDNA